MRFNIITIFPKIFDSYLKESLIKRAREKKIIDIRVHNLRDFAPAQLVKERRDSRRTVDDRPFGGGPGMVLKVEPIYNAVKKLEATSDKEQGISDPEQLRNGASKRTRAVSQRGKQATRVILFSTRGKRFNSKIARRLAEYDRLILICGRYEGVDERVAKHIADEEISIGDYVLSGGELPALVLIEAVSRHCPGFLGKYESLEEIKGSYPVYTRSEIFEPAKRKQKSRVSGKNKKWPVPKILLSGDHKKIEAWRKSRQ